MLYELILHGDNCQTTIIDNDTQGLARYTLPNTEEKSGQFESEKKKIRIQFSCSGESWPKRPGQYLHYTCQAILAPNNSSFSSIKVEKIQ